MNIIIISTLIVAILGILIGILLGIFSDIFQVEVDERITKIRECLPGNNCGSCGYAGCDAMAQAIANIMMGYAQATAEGAKLGPIGWAAMALAGLAEVTSIINQMKSINKYAEGGIAYGPTLGIFGEYSGAAHNPEVVAPLDKLQAIMGGPAPMEVEFHLKGKELVGLGKKQEHINSRNR